ncbi:MAG: hypothetical protein LUC36_03030 [Oscillospiraceae bacterium]|nr:hypothetical protein [Oscillospiraceae bacterium]
MSCDTYYIPVNYTDAGRLLGMFEIRNAVEAVIFTVPTLFFCITLLPLSLTPKIIVTLVIAAPVGGFGLIGINDDSLTRWLSCWWRWKKKRRIMLYRGEAER